MVSRQAILVLATSVLVVYLTSVSSLPSPKVAIVGDPASDQALQDVANRLNKLVNFSADPCDDFYEFACGQEKQLKEDHSIAVEISQAVQERLDLLITGPISEDLQTAGLKMVRRSFKTCLKSEQNKVENFAAIKRLVRELGGLPALGERSGWTDDKASQTSWTDLIVQLRRLGLSTDLFFKFQVFPSLFDVSKSAIHLSLPYLYPIDHSRQSYQLLVDSYLQPNMTRIEKNRFQKHLNAIVEFRLELVNILKHSGMKPRHETAGWGLPQFKPIEYLQPEDFQAMPVKSLELLVPQIDWVRLLGDMFEHPVDSETEIFVNKPEAFARVQEFLSKQDGETIRDFMMLEAIQDTTSKYLDYGICYSTVEKDLGLALTAEYVRNYLLPETRTSATVMTNYLRRELKTMIAEADWVSPMAKQGALAKADSMISYVGYPDELFDEKKMANYHSGLEIDAENHLLNVLSINKWTSRLESESLTKAQSWHIYALGIVINAFYYSRFNSINILPTLMQNFEFNSRQPNYVNFAALGFIVGHEISHAFDSSRVKYDCQGQDHCWWDPETGAEYQARSKCFEQQYNKTTVFGDYSWLNGSSVLAENIADNIGAKLAHRAYQSWLADQPAGFEEPLFRESQLAQYNQDQLFWASFAQTWCQKDMTYDGVHSPNKLRVDITLSNQDDFAVAFQCPLGSRMNPSNKCSLW